MVEPTQTAGKPQAPPGKPIEGWPSIAEAAGLSVDQIFSVRTVQRYAAPGRDNRLPVYKWQNERVYLLPEDLALWAAAWLRRRPLGAKMPGKNPKPS
jgi:hypothetical protein